jgi:hypothetical protein
MPLPSPVPSGIREKKSETPGYNRYDPLSDPNTKHPAHSSERENARKIEEKTGQD